MELEFQVVDKDTQQLLPLGPAILEEAAQDPWLEGRAHYELMENTVELVTAKTDSGKLPTRVSQLGTDMRRAVAATAKLAEKRGATLVLSGSHPFADPTKQRYTDNHRIKAMIEDIGKPMRDLQTYGLHVHVGVPDGDASIRAMNHLNQHLPLFLALTGSSPYWNGEDTKMDSYRSPAFETLRVTGPPPHMRGWSDYQAMYKRLTAQGRIADGGATNEWGGNKDIHWDVRPSPTFGTIELRISDATPTVSEALAVAALTQCLVVEAVEQGVAKKRLNAFWIKDNKDRAAERGLGADIAVAGRTRPVPVTDEIEKVVDRLAPIARRLGCADELASVKDIVRNGNGAARQRAVYLDATDGKVPSPKLDRDAARAVVRNLALELSLDRPVIVGGAQRQQPPGRAVGE